MWRLRRGTRETRSALNTTVSFRGTSCIRNLSSVVYYTEPFLFDKIKMHRLYNLIRYYSYGLSSLQLHGPLFLLKKKEKNVYTGSTL